MRFPQVLRGFSTTSSILSLKTFGHNLGTDQANPCAGIVRGFGHWKKMKTKKNDFHVIKKRTLIGIAGPHDNQLTWFKRHNLALYVLETL
jgi:hypothetical protein